MANTTALITGASSGIGAEFARVLAADGMDLILVARRAERLEDLKKEIEQGSDVSCRMIAMDLSRPEAPDELYQATQSRDWSVDWLINNAGFGTNGAFATLPLDREREEIRLNIATLVALCRLYLPDMIGRRRGQIINLGSIGSFTPSPYMATFFCQGVEIILARNCHP